MLKNFANRIGMTLKRFWLKVNQSGTATPVPFNETQRQKAVEEFQLNMPDTVDAYQEIVQQAAFVCDVPIAAMSILDGNRLLFKARVGLADEEIPREWAFCGHAIIEPDEVFQVEDASLDARFADNPLVTDDPNIRFYAGMPLLSSEGYPLGTLCVIDQEPRKLTDDQEWQLKLLTQKLMIAIGKESSNF